MSVFENLKNFCPSLAIRKGRLFIEEVDLDEIIQNFPTPVYVYSKSGILDVLNQFHKKLNTIPYLICYSVKSNSNLSILKTIVKRGNCGLDVVSGGELKRALEVGCPPDKIGFDGVGKQDWELEMALKENILLFNCESAEEIERLNLIANRTGKKAPVSIRINPDIKVNTHAYISTASSEKKFGIPLNHFEGLVKKIRSDYSSIELKGLHIHLGSQVFEMEPLQKTVSILSEMVKSFEKWNFNLEFLNLGGGFAIMYNSDGIPFPLDNWASMVTSYFKNNNLTLIIEPGRIISGPNGILLTKVIYRKQNNKKLFYIIDGAMNDLIRPSLYSAHHEIIASRKGNIIDNTNLTPADIVGPVCESGDFFAKNRPFPPLERDDILCILSAGAYGATMSSRYNSRPMTPEILVSKNKWAVIKKLENYKDLIHNEVIVDI
jgi:diaminopimelate decarboxylase